MQLGAQQRVSARVPLPEHPRPDFLRAEWQNLNGAWRFQFDPENTGETLGWQRGLPTPRTITVPFPWGSALSGLPDSAEVGWYERTLEIPAAWRDRRVFLVVGAADWHTSVWLDGQRLDTHQGGYTPFEFELTPMLEPGATARLVIRVDDVARPFKLEGKQGYGNARGIWQTVYVEARGTTPIRTLHFTPDIDRRLVRTSVELQEPAPDDLTFTIRFSNTATPPVTRRIARGEKLLELDIAIEAPHLWSLTDPYLYEVSANVTGAGLVEDRVDSYFGMRKISVVDLPGTDHRYIALNGEPIYLQLALDQAYHPDGFYVFPSDSVLREEIVRAKQIGLNGLREHVKIESPRKLYWADKLGMLIMADVPNSWGQPDADMRQEVDYALTQMIARDYNHPSIFAWVPFNETWGLFHKQGDKDIYDAETQRWVTTIYRKAKTLDPTRLVEDNSVCCGRGHTETDINSWHAYLPGWAWDEHLTTISDSTRQGSSWNFESGYRQAAQPNINSEFGNVWGYEGSTGDVDWSWDYHRAINAFRRHPRVAGWLYTEHHDVVNEWNGYWRFDRSNKETGLGELVPGMSLRDLHAPLYIAVGKQLSETVLPGQKLQVPLYASFLTSSTAYGDSLRLVAELYGWNSVGRRISWSNTTRNVEYRPYLTEALEPLEITMPSEPAVAILSVTLQDAAGHTLHRNFTTFVVEGDAPQEISLSDNRRARLLRIDPARFSDARWSLKQWNVLDGLKVNGAGSGFFEYRVAWPAGVTVADVESASFLMEASAKQLFGKDRPDAGRQQGDFMRGEGTHDPSLNPNAYPMTDERLSPTTVTLRVNGIVAGEKMFADDPADHRGILSWHYQMQDRRLREAGSYGELLSLPIPRAALERAAASGEIVIRLEVNEVMPGGLAIYGRRFGRFPLDPTIVLVPRRR
jgi:hypothetical protein